MAKIYLKSREEMDAMARAGRVLRKIKALLQKEIKQGISTGELDRIAEFLVRKFGAEPAFKGYRGFPSTICASLNEQVVHGVPGERRLKKGDIFSLDIGIKYEGFFSDTAFTVSVGRVDKEAGRLIKITRQALEKGIKKAQGGNRLSDISHAIEFFVVSEGFSVVKDFVGHGIGRALHEEPAVPNYGPPGQGPVLKNGMVLAIEPMVNMGGSRVKVESDNWTVVTADKSLSAHFEHTVAVTASGPRVLT